MITDEELDAETKERIINVSKGHIASDILEHQRVFERELTRAGLRLAALSAAERRLHILAQSAVRAFRAERARNFQTSLQDVVAVVLCHEQGRTHGRPLARSVEFNRILQIYHR